MFEPNILNFHTRKLLTIISQRTKPYFSFPDIFLISFKMKYSSDKPILKIDVSPANSYTALCRGRLNFSINAGLLLRLYSPVEAYIHSTIFIALKC
ncbi:hypothetical protein LDENG_00086510 [Lucifuga dentata]|nr:hypothetical protein LDENG_00086510 [Lucifuga dentata]